MARDKEPMSIQLLEEMLTVAYVLHGHLKPRQSSQPGLPCSGFAGGLLALLSPHWLTTHQNY